MTIINKDNIGAQGITVIDFDTWGKRTATTKATKGSKKNQKIKQIVNPIFLDCEKNTDDPFWREKFSNAAYGKFPAKFSFHNNCLIFKKGTKCLNYELGTNGYENSLGCMEFIRLNASIFSPADEQASIDLQNQRMQEASASEPLVWSDAGKKLQKCLIFYYIIDMGGLMKLSNSEMLQLRQTITLGISNKFFHKGNINMRNNRIHSIDGLLFKNDTRMFFIDPKIEPLVSRSYNKNKDNVLISAELKDTIPTFNSKWDKYLKYLDKRIVTHNVGEQNAFARSLHSKSQGDSTTDNTELTTDD